MHALTWECIPSIDNPQAEKLSTKDLSTYSQLVSLRKPDTLKNLAFRTFVMKDEIPPCASLNK